MDSSNNNYEWLLGKSIQRTIKLAVAILLTGVSVLMASEQEILIDFNGSGVAPVSTNTWNTLETVVSSNNLLDSSGVATTVDISFAGDIRVAGLASGWMDAAYPWLDDANIVASVFYTASGTLTISGLDPSRRYNIELVSSRDSDADANFKLDGVNPDNYPFSGSGGAFNAQTDGYGNHTLVVWENVFPAMDGTLDIDITHVVGWAYMNALRLTFSPLEEASEVLIDFSDVGVAPVSASTWNTLDSVETNNSLFVSSGVASTVGICFSSGILESGSSMDGWTDTAYPWLDDANIVADVFYTASGTITIFGLNTNMAYNIELVSSRNSDANSNFLLDGVNPNNYPFSGSGGAFNAQTDGYGNHTLVVWDNVFPAMDGTLEIDVNRINGWAYMNALRLILTPPPTGTIIFIN